MWLNASCLIEFQMSVPTPFLLMLRPRSGCQQWITREEYILSPRRTRGRIYGFVRQPVSKIGCTSWFLFS